MIRLILSLIVAGVAGAWSLTSQGLLVGVIFGGGSLACCLGLIRLEKLIKGEGGLTLFDTIGLVAGAFLTALTWITKVFHPWPIFKILIKLSKNPNLYWDYFMYFWAFGGCGLFTYSAIAFSAPLWGMMRKPRVYRPIAQKAAPDNDYFGFDPGSFFDHQFDEKESEPDWEWYGRERAPEGTLRLEYHSIPKKYSTKEAARMFNISGVADHPGHTKAAAALAACCMQALGPKKGLAFLNMAARDEALPKRMRQTYIHAVQVAGRA